MERSGSGPCHNGCGDNPEDGRSVIGPSSLNGGARPVLAAQGNKVPPPWPHISSTFVPQLATPFWGDVRKPPVASTRSAYFTATMRDEGNMSGFRAEAACALFSGRPPPQTSRTKWER